MQSVKYYRNGNKNISIHFLNAGDIARLGRLFGSKKNALRRNVWLTAYFVSLNK